MSNFDTQATEFADAFQIPRCAGFDVRVDLVLQGPGIPHSERNAAPGRHRLVDSQPEILVLGELILEKGIRLRALGLSRPAIDTESRIEFRSRALDAQFAGLDIEDHDAKSEIILKGNPYGLFQGKSPALADRGRAGVIACVENSSHRFQVEVGNRPNLQAPLFGETAPRVQRKEKSPGRENEDQRCSTDA